MAVDCGIKHNIIRLLAKVRVAEGYKIWIHQDILLMLIKLKQVYLQKTYCHLFLSLFAEGSRGALGTVGSRPAEFRI